MHVAVDGSIWGGQERGVAAATRRLWSAFLKTTAFPRVTVFAPSSPEPQSSDTSLVRVGPLTGASKFVWQQFVLPGLLRERGIELLYCPCYTVPVRASCRLLVSVHDLIAWTHPALAGWRNSVHFRLLVGLGVRRAQAVCVPTEFVRNAVVTAFGISRKKVFVVPWGVDEGITHLEKETATYEVKRSFGVDEPFVLFCGCVEQKKNLFVAVEACRQARISLLIAGPRISGSAGLLLKLARNGNGGWRYLGYVSNSDLSALYSAATALVFPSFAEGFGLPAIEAMNCGCSVIASDAPALREVCGGAAIHVPPHDASALAASLRAVSKDRTLRASMVERGKRRAALFTWAAAADRFAEAFFHTERVHSASARKGKEIPGPVGISDSS